MSMLPPRWLVRAALTSACLVVLAGTAWLVARALMAVLTVTASVVAALLLTALLEPVAARLRKWRFPGWAAALLTVIVTLVLVGGVFVLLVSRVQDQQADLQSTVADSVQRLRDLILSSPVPISETRLDVGAQDVADATLAALPGPGAGATLASQVLTGAALAVFWWFFLLKDGREMWAWVLGLAPRAHADGVDRAGRTSWLVITRYIRGTTIIAAADALGVGLAMLLLGVPLTASLALLVFLGAFVPIVGAFVSGGLAVGVTLVTLGPIEALVLLGCVLLVQQIEGNLLQPLVMGRVLNLHPVAIVMSVTVGALVGGVLGALVSVPLVAVVYRLGLQLSGRTEESTEEPTEEPSEATEAKG